jgi:hypothetical protein
VLGQSRPYETEYYVFAGGQPGPVVLIQAGIHGDEIAGILALDILARALQVRSGTVVLIPRMNAPAVRRGTRQINVDLNRVFGPNRPHGVYEAALADELTDLVGKRRVEYVVTLHESRNRYDPAARTGLGQTICYGVNPPPAVLGPWLDSINRRLPTARRFVPIYFPIPTSSTEVLVSRFSLKGGFCVETWSGFALQDRIGMHLLVAESFLRAAGTRYAIDVPCPALTRHFRAALRAVGLVSEETRYLECTQSIRPYLRFPW